MRRSLPRPRRAGLIVATAAALALAAGAALAPGSFSAYVAKVTNSTDTAATAPFFTCAGALAGDKASALFTLPLNEASGSTTAVDTDSGAYPGTYRGTMTTSTTTPLACKRDSGGAYVLNGTSSFVTSALQQSSPQTFSEEVWFKSTVAAGRLMGFGNSATGTSSSYDRQIFFVPSTGQLSFATYNGGNRVITSTAAYNDGNWHQVVATMSPSTGMILYVDGTVVASNATYTTAETDTGYWRIGYDNLNGWVTAGTNYYFTGQMRFASVFSTVLTAAQVSAHYNAGR